MILHRTIIEVQNPDGSIVRRFVIDFPGENAGVEWACGWQEINAETGKTNFSSVGLAAQYAALINYLNELAGLNLPILSDVPKEP